MSIDVRRFDDLLQVVRDMRRRLDDSVSTILARLGSHTHPHTHPPDAPPSGHGFLATSQGTTSTTFTDLATAGPSATVTVGASGAVLVHLSACIDPVDGEGGEVGVATSGATVRTADTNRTTRFDGHVMMTAGSSYVHTGLTAGSNTFTMKYRRSLGAGTATFSDRQIVVIPL